jgi:hypothetical protein
MGNEEHARRKEYTINEARRGITYSKIKGHRRRGSQRQAQQTINISIISATALSIL